MFYNNNVIYCTFILFSSGLFEMTWPQIDQSQLCCNSINNSLIMPATHLKKHCHCASTTYKAKRNCHSLPTPILYKISSDPRHQLQPFNVPMMDTLIKQELNHAIWYNANTDQLINLYFQDVVTNDILAKNVMIMKWQGTWCKPAKVKPSLTPNTANMMLQFGPSFTSSHTYLSSDSSLSQPCTYISCLSFFWLTSLTTVYFFSHLFHHDS